MAAIDPPMMVGRRPTRSDRNAPMAQPTGAASEIITV
jgi:hypothetical protein